ncbi:MAG TPA: 6,7-dimethyl-8-ribityllumazine synthase [Firmicutes bacterium]|nr:6,7-dimethyl-8-ribityllumazine synthase [Bacillota bacterium]
MRFIEGHLKGEKKKIAVVIGRFNDFINRKLLEGAEDCFVRHGGDSDDIDVYPVPGAFEIPYLLRRLVNKGGYDGIICLATVIRGGTPHFEYVASEVSKGIAHISLEGKIPVAFGVLTTDTIEQAIERAGTKMGNKGWDAALSLMELMDLSTKLK